MNCYKRLVVLIVAIFAMSGAVIYFTGDIHLFRHLNAFQPWSVILALAFLSVGMYFDSTRLVTLAKMAGEHITLVQSLQVILSNYCLAMLTPGATGGPVAQVLFLRKMGMPTGEATVVVLIRTILSVLFLIVCLPIVVYVDAIQLPWLRSDLVTIAAVVSTLFAVGSIWLIRTRIMKRLVLWIVRRLPNPLRQRVWKIFGDVRSAVGLLLSAPKGMAKVFLDTGLSLLTLYCIVPALFLGLGVAVDWPTILGRMIVLNLLLYIAPTPGGAGVAEGAFVFLFSSFVPPGTVGVLAVAWRVLAEYLPFIAGLYFTLKMFGSKLLVARQATR